MSAISLIEITVTRKPHTILHSHYRAHIVFKWRIILFTCGLWYHVNRQSIAAHAMNDAVWFGDEQIQITALPTFITKPERLVLKSR